MPNIKSLAQIVSEIWPKQDFGGHFEPDGGATPCPKSSQFVSS